MCFAGDNLVNTQWQVSSAAQALALVAYVAGIIIYLAVSSMKAGKQK